MTWYCEHRRHSLVIREEGSDEYVAEIDVRYDTPENLKKAQERADEIVEAHNARKGVRP